VNVSFDQAMSIIEKLVILIALILLYRSVPAAQLESLFVALEKAAKQTPTTVDDAVIPFGRLLAQLLSGQIPGQPALAGDTPAPTAQPVPIAVTGVVTASPASVPAAPIDQVDTQLTSESEAAG
jgi:hypothetical protein